MQKKLIAVAIAGLASSGVFAQMNVTISGKIDMAVQNAYGTSSQTQKDALGNSLTGAGSQSGVGQVIANGTSNSTNFGTAAAALSAFTNASNYSAAGSQMSMFSPSTSMVSIKGTEDLGGGMKVDFNVQTDLFSDYGTGQAVPAADTASGGGIFGGAEAWVALTNSSIGQAKFGRMDNILITLAGAMDPWLGKAAGGINNMAVLPFASTQVNNAIQLSSKLGGLAFGYQYAMSENQGSVASTGAVNAPGGGSISTAFVYYKEGPLTVVGGQGVARDYNAATGVKLGAKFVGYALGATYDFGPAKLHTLLQTGKATRANNGVNCVAAGTTTVTTCETTSLIDSRTYLIGVTVPMGAHAFKASYINTDDRRNFDMDASSIGLGYEYSLSKRTTFYARAASVSNKNGAMFAANSAAGAKIVADSQALTGGANLNFGAGGNAINGINTVGSGLRTNAVMTGMMHTF